jgi:hypothetical protein
MGPYFGQKKQGNKKEAFSRDLRVAPVNKPEVSQAMFHR